MIDFVQRLFKKNLKHLWGVFYVMTGGCHKPPEQSPNPPTPHPTHPTQPAPHPTSQAMHRISRLVVLRHLQRRSRRRIEAGSPCSRVCFYCTSTPPRYPIPYTELRLHLASPLPAPTAFSPFPQPLPSTSTLSTAGRKVIVDPVLPGFDQFAVRMC